MNAGSLGLCGLVGLIAATSIAAADDSFEVIGFAAARGAWVEGQPGWVEGGFGRFALGGDGVGEGELVGRAEAQLGLIWRPGVSWRGEVHALARAEGSDAIGRSLGLTQAWLSYQRALGDQAELSTRVGMFFFPGSQENIDPLWGSPYTLTFSALNSWFAEEFRPQGVDFEWRRFIGNGRELSVGLTGFGGNDTLGTLIAWRGWAMHDRLSVHGERLALPPVFSLEESGSFGQTQRAFRTTGFGADLDGRPGYALRLRADDPGRFSVQAAWVDNRGDRDLQGQEYAWRTRFALLGGHWQLNERVELMAEWTQGQTTMNFPGMPWVDADFRAGYLMASWQSDVGRWSLRHDRFGVDDLLGNLNWGVFDDRGQAWTLAWIHHLGQRSRLGVELVHLDSNRTVAAQSGFPSDTNGTSLSLEWRIVF